MGSPGNTQQIKDFWIKMADWRETSEFPSKNVHVQLCVGKGISSSVHGEVEIRDPGGTARELGLGGGMTKGRRKLFRRMKVFIIFWGGQRCWLFWLWWWYADIRNGPTVTLNRSVYYAFVIPQQRLPWWLSSKESACQWKRCGFHPWVRTWPYILFLISIVWTEKRATGLQKWIQSIPVSSQGDINFTSSPGGTTGKYLIQKAMKNAFIYYSYMYSHIF